MLLLKEETEEPLGADPRPSRLHAPPRRATAEAKARSMTELKATIVLTELGFNSVKLPVVVTVLPVVLSELPVVVTVYR